MFLAENRVFSPRSKGTIRPVSSSPGLIQPRFSSVDLATIQLRIQSASKAVELDRRVQFSAKHPNRQSFFRDRAERLREDAQLSWELAIRYRIFHLRQAYPLFSNPHASNYLPPNEPCEREPREKPPPGLSPRQTADLPPLVSSSGGETCIQTILWATPALIRCKFASET